MRSVLLTMLVAALPVSTARAIDYSAPTETLKACPRHGAGFFQIPGSTTCIRVGGRVTADAGTGGRRVGRDRVAGIGGSATVTVDARADTAYGPVRTFVRLRAGDPDWRGSQAYITTR